MSFGPEKRMQILGLIERRARAGAPAPNQDDIAAELGVSPSGCIASALRELARGRFIEIQRAGSRRRFRHVATGCWTGWSGNGQDAARAALRECILGVIAAAAKAGAPAPTYVEMAHAAGWGGSIANVQSVVFGLIEAGEIEVEKPSKFTLRYRHRESGCWTGYTQRNRAGGKSSPSRSTESMGSPERRLKCMTCGNPFPSEHKGHRMCDHCRGTAASISPYEIQSYAVRAG